MLFNTECLNGLSLYFPSRYYIGILCHDKANKCDLVAYWIKNISEIKKQTISEASCELQFRTHKPDRLRREQGRESMYFSLLIYVYSTVLHSGEVFLGRSLMEGEPFQYQEDNGRLNKLSHQHRIRLLRRTWQKRHTW